MNFLHYILNQPSESIVNQVFVEQVKSPNRNDWIKLIEQDIEVLRIELSYDEIKNMSKYSFKSLIKKKTNEAALAYLNKLKKKHSKVENIDHPNLTIQAYFSADDSDKTIRNVQDLFKIRSRML